MTMFILTAAPTGGNSQAWERLIVFCYCLLLYLWNDPMLHLIYYKGEKWIKSEVALDCFEVVP